MILKKNINFIKRKLIKNFMEKLVSNEINENNTVNSMNILHLKWYDKLKLKSNEIKIQNPVKIWQF